MNRLHVLAGATALAFVAPAVAGTATLTNRVSISQITLFAGLGPARVDFADGSPAPLSLADAALIAVNGQDSGNSVFGPFTVSFDAIWNQQQNYSFQGVGADAVLHATGSLAVTTSSSGATSGLPAVATHQFSSSNWQSFEFELDTATSFSFTGQAIDGQSFQAFRWFNNNWTSAASIISPGSGTSFSNSGTLDAGRYLIRNTPNVITRTQGSFYSNQWDYSLTLHNSTAAVVPEPASLASMLAGLGLIGWRLRKRQHALI